VVILSGLSDKKIALDIVKQGAQDYIVKGEFDANLLEKAIVYSIERKKYQEILEESERRSRTIFESVGIAIAEYDYTGFYQHIQETKATGITYEAFVEGMDLDRVRNYREQMRVLNMNPEALLLYGYERKEDFEENVSRFYGEQFVDYFKEVVRAIWNDRVELVYEIPFRGQQNQLIHTLKRWRFLGFQSGFYRLLVSTEDVTRIKENEEKVYRQSRVMEGVAEAASILLGEGDISRRLQRVLELAGKSLGGACMAIYRFQLEGEHIHYRRTHLWMRDALRIEVGVEGTFSSETTMKMVAEFNRSVPVLIHRNTGDAELASILEAYNVEFTVLTPFQTKSGGGCITLSFDRQITTPDYIYSAMMTLASSVGAALATWTAREQLQQINEELEQRVFDRTEKMRQAIQELESFSYSVSHDLRAPLRTISGFTGVLHEEYHDQLDDDGRKFLDNIRRGASEMSQLIDDLLNFSRTGRKKLSFDQVDMKHLVEEVVAELGAHVPERAITFEVSDLPWCVGDQSMIRQVVVNFIWNAIKFTKNEALAKISVDGFVNDKGFCSYTVSDNGVGFNMAYADKLFGVFQRLHQHEDFDGTGVGLAIVQRIVSRHGGDVVAYGEENVGAKFTFTLPREAQEDWESAEEID
jgi:signal transduction histidine kinase